MLGWWIIVSTQSPEEIKKSTKEALREAILAHWEVGPCGLTWIENLVKAGRGVKLSDGGYPNRYTASAGDVLPLIENEGIKPVENNIMIFGEDYIKPMDWMEKPTVHADRIIACSANQILTIEAWDLS